MEKLISISQTILFSITLIATHLIISSYTQKTQQESDAYYVFSDKWEHGVPTGFMGERDGKSIKIDDKWAVKPYKGETCIKIAVDNTEKWRGIHIQYTGGWNVSLDENTPLANLSEYDKLEFYARAETSNGAPYILTEIGVGGGGAPEEKVDDTYLEISPEWEKYTISLKGADFKRVNTLLYMSMPVGTLYMDEVRFVKKKKK